MALRAGFSLVTHTRAPQIREDGNQVLFTRRVCVAFLKTYENMRRKNTVSCQQVICAMFFASLLLRLYFVLLFLLAPSEATFRMLIINCD